MRRIIVKLLIIFVPLGLLISGTNYLVDPANIFSPGYINGIAQSLTRGHNIDNLANYDERLLQEHMIKLLPKTPDIVILGSSRVMEINSNFFPGKKILNCGVSHGNIHDVVSIIGVLDSMNKLPHEVIIGMDHMLLGKKGTLEWQSLYPYHEYMLSKKLPSDLHSKFKIRNPFRKLSALFGFDYFQSSLQFIIKGNSKQYVDVGTDTPRTYGRFSDGSIYYSETYTRPNLVKLAADAKIRGRKDGLHMPDQSKISLFEGLIDYLQMRKVKVRLIMIPYYPVYYKAVEENHPQVIKESEPMFRAMAARHHLTVSGDFDADSVGISERDFYDIIHCSGEAIKKHIPMQ